jgi:hypothetical protein
VRALAFVRCRGTPPLAVLGFLVVCGSGKARGVSQLKKNFCPMNSQCQYAKKVYRAFMTEGCDNVISDLQQWLKTDRRHKIRFEIF